MKPLAKFLLFVAGMLAIARFGIWAEGKKHEVFNPPCPECARLEQRVLNLERQLAVPEVQEPRRPGDHVPHNERHINHNLQY